MNVDDVQRYVSKSWCRIRGAVRHGPFDVRCGHSAGDEDAPQIDPTNLRDETTKDRNMDELQQWIAVSRCYKTLDY